MTSEMGNKDLAIIMWLPRNGLMRVSLLTTVIGTTDIDHNEDIDIEAGISDQEVDYLLKAFNSQFPNNTLNRSDVLSTWAGVRPVIGAEKSKDPSKERRDHAVWSDNGLITVSGGKLTTFRLIALDALAAAKDNLPAAKEIFDDRVFLTPAITLRLCHQKILVGLNVYSVDTVIRRLIL